MSSAIISKTQQEYTQSTSSDVLNILNRADFWLDLSDSACITTTAKAIEISTLSDKSSSPKSITRTGVRYDSIANGIRLDGAGSDYITITGMSTPGTVAATAQETIFMVCWQFSASAGAYIGSNTTGVRYIRSDSSSISYGRVGSGGITLGSLSGGYLNLYVMTCVLSNGVAYQYINGNPNNYGSYTMTATSTTQAIGRVVNPVGPVTYPLRGGFHEVIVFNTALSDTQRRMVDNYLINKWSVQTTSLTTPLSVSGCTLWLDGNDGSTITYGTGSLVQQWADKSGNGYHAIQNTGSKQPTYDSTAKGVLFNATNLTALTTTAPFSTTETVFTVVGMSSTAGDIIGTTNSSRGRQLRTIIGTNAIRMISDVSTLTTGVNGGTSFNTTDKYVISYVNDVTNNFFEQTCNGLQDGLNITALSYSAGSYTTIIGATTSTTNVFNYNSYIYEIIIFNSALTVAQRKDITYYLMNKWGVKRFQTPRIGFPFYKAPYMRFFNPLDIAGCHTWVDAADQSVVTKSGSYVTSVTNKGSTGTTFSPNNSTTLTTSTINGLQTIRFPGNPGSLTNSSSTCLSTGTAVVVFNATNLNNAVYSPIFAWRLAPIASTFTLGFGFPSTTTLAPYVSNAGTQTPTTTLSSTIPNVYIAILNWVTSGATTLGVNGQLAYSTGTTRSLNATVTCPLYLGLDTSSYLQYDLGELIIYNSIIPIGSIRALEGYLAHKWGLRSNLPSGHMYKTLIPTTATFTPLSLDTQCTLWLDGADGTTIQTSGGFVTQWNDKSGNDYHAISQGTGPTYNTTTNALVWTGSENMRGTATRLHNATTGNWSAFAVASTTSSSYDLLLNYDNSVRIAQFLRKTDSGTGSKIESIAFTTTGTPIITTSTAGVSTNTLFLAEAVNDTTNLTTYLNGTAGTPSNNGANAIAAGTFYSVGVYDDTAGYVGNYWNGNICEIIVYSSDLTATERQRVEGYLAWKWGIQSSLPSTHTYYKYPPA